jgi:glycosyltransferase involved in cell wall biosynthesis
MNKVSVVIPAYNKADLTVRTVKSVLSQSYKNIETIVVDDGSTDDTKEKLEQFGNKICYLYQNNNGACSARNFGIKQATGEYIGLIDCDDIYYPEKIEKSVSFLEDNPDYGFISTGAYFIDESDKIVSGAREPKIKPSGWIFAAILRKNIIYNSTVVAKRDCFERVGYFDEKIFIPADYDMWIRLAEVYKAGYLAEKLTGYRISHNYFVSHPSQLLNESIYLHEKHIRKGYIASKRLQKKYLSDIYYSFAILFGSINNNKKASELFLKTIRNYPFYPKIHKILVGLLLSYLWPQKLNKILTRSQKESNMSFSQDIDNN